MLCCAFDVSWRIDTPLVALRVVNVRLHNSFEIRNNVFYYLSVRTKWPLSIRANGHLLLNSEKVLTKC